MSRSIWGISVFGLLLLGGCSGGSRVESYDSAIERTSLNQVSIRINGVRPGITADEALIEEQGFQQARDRFFQMDLMRRGGRGKLAELFGEKAYAKDTEVISIGFRLAIERNLKRIEAEDPVGRRLLDAYARGVNRYISNLAYESPHLLATYRKQYTKSPTYLPEPWVAEDSLAIALAVSFFLQSGLEEKIALAKVALLFSPDLDERKLSDFADFYDWRPIENTFIMDAGHNPRPFLRPVTKRGKDKREARKVFAGFDVKCDETKGYPFPGCQRVTAMGSNNWVLGPSRTGGRYALMANDPHLPLTFPWAFYEMALDSKAAGGTLRARGYNLPGMPGILIGHNDDIGWSFTNNPSDGDDVYIEFVSADEKSVEFNGRAVALQTREEKVGVRRADGSVEWRTEIVRIVPHHGPIFTDFSAPEIKNQLPRLASNLKKLPGRSAASKRDFPKIALSYRWTGLEGTGEYTAITRVNRAKNFDEFKSALQTFETGTQNMVFFDRSGNIGYYSHGKYPLRPHARRTWPPFVPALGDGTMEWKGWRTEMPELYNPSAGRIVTANNDVYGHSGAKDFHGYRDYLGYGYSTGVRAARITQLIDALPRGKAVGIADMQRIQLDHFDLYNYRMNELLREHRDKLKLNAEQRDVLDELLAWDCVATRDAHAPILADKMQKRMRAWYFWRRELPWIFQLRSEKEIVPQGLMGATTAAKSIYHYLQARLPRSDGYALTMVQNALDSVVREMKADGLKNGTWGQYNRLQFAHRMEGILPAVSFPIERDGTWETVDVAGASYGPNFRLVMKADANGIEAVSASPGGNYTSVTDGNWSRELKDWRDGRYRPLPDFIR